MKDWSILEWAGALAGEAGEAANVAKKMVRTGGVQSHHPEGDGPTFENACKLAAEIADVIIYADLVMRRLEKLHPQAAFRLEEFIAGKFNAVSRKLGDGLPLLPEEYGEDSAAQKHFSF